MQVKIKPELINNENFEGWILVDIPANDERMTLLKTLNLKVQGTEVVQSDDQMDTIIAMNKIARERIIEAEVTYKPTGQVLTKEEILVYEEFQQVLAEVANLCVRGLTLGKKL